MFLFFLFPSPSAFQFFPLQRPRAIKADVFHTFSASPVAADGKIYCAGEDGLVFVVQAGETFKLLATNFIGEPLMATPALSDGVMYLRGTRTLFAVGKSQP